MDPSQLTEEQKRDINERVTKAKTMLEELQLTPQASVQAINTGDDIFAMKVVVYLQDSKFLSLKSSEIEPQ